MCTNILQLWENILLLKTPNNEDIIERWTNMVTSVIKNRVEKVCYYSTCKFSLFFLSLDTCSVEA